MKNKELKPIKLPCSVGVLSGSNYDDVKDLPIVRIGNGGLNGPAWECVISTWKVNFIDRLKFLFDGKVNLVCMGPTHPPICVTVGDYFEKRKDPNGKT